MLSFVGRALRDCACLSQQTPQHTLVQRLPCRCCTAPCSDVAWLLCALITLGSAAAAGVECVRALTIHPQLRRCCARPAPSSSSSRWRQRQNSCDGARPCRRANSSSGCRAPCRPCAACGISSSISAATAAGGQLQGRLWQQRRPLPARWFGGAIPPAAACWSSDSGPQQPQLWQRM